MASSIQANSPVLDTSRPSLLPLWSLCLPDIRTRRTSFNVPDVDSSLNDLLPPLLLDFNQSWPHVHQSSVSSATTSCIPLSRPSSCPSIPTEAWAPRHQPITRTARRHHPYLLSDKYHVVLSDSYDDADAMLILLLPAEAVDKNNRPIPDKLKWYNIGKVYLIVGPLAHRLRDSRNCACLRAAVHPYHIIPRNPLSPANSQSHSNATPTGSMSPHRESTTSDSLNAA